jgi:GNAT superfamily N-acetyltransferase
MPNRRHEGAGELLVRHILKYAKEKGVVKVSIGIIAAHSVLKSWYVRLGFIEKHTQTFEHLPFDVTYMHYEL